MASFAIAAIYIYIHLGPDVPVRAPNVTFQTLNGKTLELEDISGPLLITFWATDCVICHKKLPDMIALYDELTPRDVTIIGVAMPHDPPNKVVNYVKAYEIPYSIATDTDERITSAFGDIQGTPTNILIDNKGWVVSRMTGSVDMAHLKQRILSL